ncbi:hypothetical protein [Caballeronia arvi]|uniref:hypothetical protein n=1 Tax=Caballeronia arvi TaxID=1777135 RepID=UPI0007724F7C|nr:hypothetical protein [Caballeronia arvi]
MSHLFNFAGASMAHPLERALGRLALNAPTVLMMLNWRPAISLYRDAGPVTRRDLYRRFAKPDRRLCDRFARLQRIACCDFGAFFARREPVIGESTSAGSLVNFIDTGQGCDSTRAATALVDTSFALKRKSPLD